MNLELFERWKSQTSATLVFEVASDDGRVWQCWRGNDGTRRVVGTQPDPAWDRVMDADNDPIGQGIWAIGLRRELDKLGEVE